MMRLFSIGADERGASIIELALTAPFFAAMLIGMIDLSRAYSMKLKLEQSAQRAVEKIGGIRDGLWLDAKGQERAFYHVDRPE